MGVKVRRKLLHGGDNESQVRISGLAKWSGDANADRIGGGQFTVFCGGLEPSRLHDPGQALGGDVLDIALSAVQRSGPIGADLHTEHLVPFFSEQHGQGQSHISKAHHSYGGVPGLEFPHKLLPDGRQVGI